MSSAVWLRRLRLASGIVLMAFVLCHLTQLALGVLSLATIEAYLGVLTFPWESRVGEALLLGAALVHTAAGLQAIAARRSLALSSTDVVQLVLALLIVPLLVSHVMLTRFAQEIDPDFFPSYRLLLAAYWSYMPGHAYQQLAAAIIVWTHGAIGIYSRLVLLPVWGRIGGLVLVISFAVPVLALLGFVRAGQEVLAKLAEDGQFRREVETKWGEAVATMPNLDRLQAAILAVYGLAALAALGALAARALMNRRHRVHVAYDGGTIAEGRRGLSILELSQLNGVPHAHVCSGRGRCGTCRVAVEAGADQLSPVTELERGTLAAVRADAEVRLACQARVLGPGVRVTRLLPAYVDAVTARDWEQSAGEILPPQEVAP
jgi:adenylate cyclase